MPWVSAAAELSQRAEATSGDVAARAAEADAVNAAVAQTKVSFFPRLADIARYTRLSNVEMPLLGVWVPRRR